MRGVSMESRIAVISIIVENSDSVECLNRILHEYGIYIIGRMGIPYRQRGISIISVAIVTSGYNQCTDRKNWPAGRGFSKNSLFESLEEMKIYGISRVADT